MFEMTYRFTESNGAEVTFTSSAKGMLFDVVLRTTDGASDSGPRAVLGEIGPLSRWVQVSVVRELSISKAANAADLDLWKLKDAF